MLANRVYALCHTGALAKDFGLRDQLQRAAVSVMNNVAEGWESFHRAEKRQAYNIARRSCGEVRPMSYVLLDNNFVDAQEHAALVGDTIVAGKLITGLMRTLPERD